MLGLPSVGNMDKSIDDLIWSWQYENRGKFTPHERMPTSQLQKDCERYHHAHNLMENEHGLKF
jgi:hypothetical protein